jgi:hypothetical protein
LEQSEVAPEELANGRFTLARVLGPDRSQRARARALAEQALGFYAELGQCGEHDLGMVQAWLADHPYP